MKTFLSGNLLVIRKRNPLNKFRWPGLLKELTSPSFRHVRRDKAIWGTRWGQDWSLFLYLPWSHAAWEPPLSSFCSQGNPWEGGREILRFHFFMALASVSRAQCYMTTFLFKYHHLSPLSLLVSIPNSWENESSWCDLSQISLSGPFGSHLGARARGVWFQGARIEAGRGGRIRGSAPERSHVCYRGSWRQQLQVCAFVLRIQDFVGEVDTVISAVKCSAPELYPLILWFLNVSGSFFCRKQNHPSGRMESQQTPLILSWRHTQEVRRWHYYFLMSGFLF